MTAKITYGEFTLVKLTTGRSFYKINDIWYQVNASGLDLVHDSGIVGLLEALVEERRVSQIEISQVELPQILIHNLEAFREAIG